MRPLPSPAVSLSLKNDHIFRELIELTFESSKLPHVDIGVPLDILVVG